MVYGYVSSRQRRRDTLLKTNKYAAGITLQFRHMTTLRLLNNILLNILVRLSSGNLIIAIAVCGKYTPTPFLKKPISKKG